MTKQILSILLLLLLAQCNQFTINKVDFLSKQKIIKQVENSSNIDIKPIKCMQDMADWGQQAMNLGYEISTMQWQKASETYNDLVSLSAQMMLDCGKISENQEINQIFTIAFDFLDQFNLVFQQYQNKTQVEVKPIKCMQDMADWGQLAMNLGYEMSTMQWSKAAETYNQLVDLSAQMMQDCGKIDQYFQQQNLTIKPIKCMQDMADWGQQAMNLGYEISTMQWQKAAQTYNDLVDLSGQMMIDCGKIDQVKQAEQNLQLIQKFVISSNIEKNNVTIKPVKCMQDMADWGQLAMNLGYEMSTMQWSKAADTYNQLVDLSAQMMQDCGKISQEDETNQVEIKPLQCMKDMEDWGQLAMNLGYEISTMQWSQAADTYNQLVDLSAQMMTDCGKIQKESDAQVMQAIEKFILNKIQEKFNVEVKPVKCMKDMADWAQLAMDLGFEMSTMQWEKAQQTYNQMVDLSAQIMIDCGKI